MERVLVFMQTKYPCGVYLEQVEALYEYAINDLLILISQNKVIRIASIRPKTDIYVLTCFENNASDNLKSVWHSL